MKLSPEDVHALALIALDPQGEFAASLFNSLQGKVRDVAQALISHTDISLLDNDIRSAVSEIRSWADRRRPTSVPA